MRCRRRRGRNRAPLATAWQSNKFLNPATDGAVLPILHLNGFKISNPTILSRIEHKELEQFFQGCGWTPYFVEGDDPETMHQLMAATLDKAVSDIRQIQANARSRNETARPRWPMIVLRSPKGWTGPKVVDGLQVEGTFRAHQVPLLVDPDHPEHVAQLESWMKSYKAEELFDEHGRLLAELAELAPKGDRRMGANPHANGGLLLHDLRMPDFHQHAVTVPSPGAVAAQDTMVLGKFLRDVAKLNQAERNFRIFGPDETLSNLLGAVFEVTNRQWDAREVSNDEFLAPAGQVLDSMLSEHQCEGWLEGYLLTGLARPVQQLRGIYPHRRLDVQSAREMVEGHARASLAPADFIIELFVGIACVATGSQRIHPSGPRVPRPCDQQEGQYCAGVSAARCQLSAVGV